VTGVEATVRAMTRAERVAFLQAAGWHRLSSHGSQCWLAPGWQRQRGYVTPGPDRAFYSLAAAIRKAVRRATR
jgi:hypothetical protein